MFYCAVGCSSPFCALADLSAAFSDATVSNWLLEVTKQMAGSDHLPLPLPWWCAIAILTLLYLMNGSRSFPVRA